MQKTTLTNHDQMIRQKEEMKDTFKSLQKKTQRKPPPMAGGKQRIPEEILMPGERAESGDKENKYHKARQHDDKNTNKTCWREEMS